MPYVDVCIANEEDSKDVLVLRLKVLTLKAENSIMRDIFRLPRKLLAVLDVKVAITLRGSISASINDWAGMLYDTESNKASFSKTIKSC